VWTQRRLQPLGLVVLGSDQKQDNHTGMQNARFESGLDNSPMYDSPPVFYDNTTNRMLLYDIGMTSLFISECHALSKLGRILGRTQQSNELDERFTTMISLMEQWLWDEKAGTYVNRRSDTNDTMHRYSPTHFYPMLSGSIPDAHALSLITKHLTNSAEFCVGNMTEFAIPSCSHSDPAFQNQDYWRGRIWGPMNLLVYLGLRQYDRIPEARAARKALCLQSSNLLLGEWLTRGHVHENYNGMTGEGCDVGNSDPFYHWGALLGFINLMEAGFV